MVAKRGRLIAEVVLVTAAYVVFTRLSIAGIDLAGILPNVLSAEEARIGGVFLVGALAQLFFVAAATVVSQEFRTAVRATVQPAPQRAWIIALAAAAIHCATIAAFFIPDPSRIAELSARNTLLSLLPISDGWTQEVVFRGYVLMRLAKAAVPVPLQIIVSALAFASIHVGYIGSEGLGVLWPLIGTATLGGILAWSVVAARGSILPATVAHMAIIAVVQPWLVMAA
jgi:hypothetical protein